MSESTFYGVKMIGVAAAVPDQLRTMADDAKMFGEDDVFKISESTGVKQRYVSTTLSTSDLCFAAATKLFSETGCDPETIDALIFVSQTPDYILPATSCCLQERLGLPQKCAAFDINLGCSGYVYGLWMASSLIASGAVGRVLLLVGDTSRHCSPEDRSVSLLFGDAGAATLLERSDQADPSNFVLGTDGSGEKHLIIEAGHTRMPLTPENQVKVECEGGNRRSKADLYMNGAEIFAFTLRVVPSLIKKVLANANQSIETIDAFVFHQANKFMLEHLGKRMKIPKEKLVLALESVGNTSSASIPMAFVTHLRDRLQNESLNLVLAGFGVGFSWAGANMQCGPLVIPELIKVPVPSITE